MMGERRGTKDDFEEKKVSGWEKGSIGFRKWELVEFGSGNAECGSNEGRGMKDEG